MAKVTRVPWDGKPFFGGRGVLIPIRKPLGPIEAPQQSAERPAPEQTTDGASQTKPQTKPE
jgi:hypothetical protein